MSRSSWLAILLVLGAVAVAIGGFTHYAKRDPAIRYLPRETGAEWIVYPVPPDPILHVPSIPLTAVIRRSFVIDAKPQTALLRIRALGQCQLTVNGNAVGVTDPFDWKQSADWNIASQLRSGENEIVAKVTYNQSPPALWLALTIDDQKLGSDERWTVSLAGATERQARLATAAPDSEMTKPQLRGEKTTESMARCWPWLLLFAAISTCCLAFAHMWQRWRHAASNEAATNWPRWVLMLGIALWIALFCINLLSLDYPLGFDSDEHLTYIRYIHDNVALPLADEGWQTHQPPLYYSIAAGVLSLFRLSTTDPRAIVVLRCLSLVVGIAQLVLIYASLRFLFPDRQLAQISGLIVAISLPAQLYLSQYVTNEVLAGALGTAGVYLSLRILRADRPSPALYGWLGVVLAAGALTKVSLLVLVVVVFAALVGRFIAQRQYRPTAWLSTIGFAMIVFLVLAGWHYGRVYHRFGTPLVGSYDVRSNFVWWQDPGQSNLDYFMRFGRVLVEPYYAVFQGFGDGLYSTLWGDGLWGGEASVYSRPPWNYELMAVGYLLALLPSALILLGFLTAIAQFVRRPSAEWFLLLGLAVSMSMALVHHFLRVPYACHVKAFYLLSALVPLAAFAGLGFELLAKPHRFTAMLLGVGLGTWALTSYFSYWVLPNSAATLTQRGLHCLQVAQRAESERKSSLLKVADRLFLDAIETDPTYRAAHFSRVKSLLESNQIDEARKQIQQTLLLHPDDAQTNLLAGQIALQEKKLDEACKHLEKSLAAATTISEAHLLLGRVLEQQGETDLARRTYRDGLAVSPADGALHGALGLALERAGMAANSIEHLRLAIRLKRDIQSLGKLAWILATHPDDNLRNGKEAVSLARRACSPPDHLDPLLLDILAAAEAEAGSFPSAVEDLQRGIEQAEKKGMHSLRAEMEKRLKLYEQGKPYRTSK